MATMSSGGTTDESTSPHLNNSCGATDGVGHLAVYACLMSILLLCNGFVLIAIATNWRVLRQNVVYRYLISCLASAIAYCLLIAYELLHTESQIDNTLLVNGTVLQSYNTSIEVHRRIMYSWAYRKCLVVASLLIMEFNVVALSSAVSDSTQFVGRYSQPKPVSRPPPDHQKLKKKLFRLRLASGKNCKATFMIISAWIVPLLLSIPTASVWNCVEHCKCLPAYRLDYDCDPPDGDGCGHVWLPMTRSFVLAVALLHTAASIMTFTLVGIVIKKFYQTHAPRKAMPSLTESKRMRIGKVNAKGRRNSHGGFKNTSETPDESQCDEGTMTRSKSAVVRRFESMSDLRNIAPKHSDEFASAQITKKKMKEKMFSSPSSSLPRKSRPPLPSTIKLLIAVAFSSFFSVSPIVFICLYDVLTPASAEAPKDSASKKLAFVISVALTFLHAAVLPGLHLAYMSGLRKACANISLKCPCLLTTEMKKDRQLSGASLGDKAPVTDKVLPDGLHHNSKMVENHDSSGSSNAGASLRLKAQSSLKESSSTFIEKGKLISLDILVDSTQVDASIVQAEVIADANV